MKEITETEISVLADNMIHWNPNHNGGYREYYFFVPHLRNTSISVVFNAPYAVHGCMVGIQTTESSIAMRFVRTMDQLAQLYELFTGMKFPTEPASK